MPFAPTYKVPVRYLDEIFGTAFAEPDALIHFADSAMGATTVSATVARLAYWHVFDNANADLFDPDPTVPAGTICGCGAPATEAIRFSPDDTRFYCYPCS